MSRAGIKQIIMCELGTLLSAPANVVAIGLRNGCTMEITPYKTIKDYRGRELPNMDNIKIEAESLQPSLRMFKKLIDFTNHNCDVQVTSARQSASAARGDVYRFTGDYSPGVDFELVYSGDKRSIKVTLERAFPRETADELLSAFETQQAAVITGLANEEGIDFIKYRMPYTLAVESPLATRICQETDFESRKLTIKTKGKKSVFNSTFVDYLSVTLELVIRDASIAGLITQRGKGISPAFLWKESNGGNCYDAFEFAAGALAQKSELHNNDDERTMKIIYAGDIPIYDLSFEFGAGKGGDESEMEGIKGGTIKIG